MKDLMTIEELADYLRVTKKTVYRLLKRNEIPGIKINSRPTCQSGRGGRKGNRINIYWSARWSPQRKMFLFS